MRPLESGQTDKWVSSTCNSKQQKSTALFHGVWQTFFVLGTFLVIWTTNYIPEQPALFSFSAHCMEKGPRSFLWSFNWTDNFLKKRTSRFWSPDNARAASFASDNSLHCGVLFAQFSVFDLCQSPFPYTVHEKGEAQEKHRTTRMHEHCNFYERSQQHFEPANWIFIVSIFLK